MTLKPRRRASGASKLCAFYMNNAAPLRRSSSAPLCRNLDNKARSRGSSCEGKGKKKKKKKKKKKNDIVVEEEGIVVEEECSSGGREMLQRYRKEVAGRVRIPEAWAEDEEERLKEWADPKVVDRCLAPDGLLSARTALIRDSLSVSVCVSLPSPP